MFAAKFFGPRYYADTYFARGSDTEPPVVESSNEPYWTDVIGFRLIGG